MTMDVSPHFADRSEAGRRLLAEVALLFDDDATSTPPLVLGIPRGGVPVAAEIARGLHADLDVVVVKKIGAPYQAEVAVGAVTSDGHVFLRGGRLPLGVSENYIETEARRLVREARAREENLRVGRPAPSVRGGPVVVVDDGLATGATMGAAVVALRGAGAQRIIVAVPVGSVAAVRALRREADEVVCLATPENFSAVGFFYDDFSPVEENEVRDVLMSA